MVTARSSIPSSLRPRQLKMVPWVAHRPIVNRWKSMTARAAAWIPLRRELRCKSRTSMTLVTTNLNNHCTSLSSSIISQAWENSKLRRRSWANLIANRKCLLHIRMRLWQPKSRLYRQMAARIWIPRDRSTWRKSTSSFSTKSLQNSQHIFSLSHFNIMKGELHLAKDVGLSREEIRTRSMIS